MKKELSNTNHKYKDALFKFIFGNEDHKEFALSLYNAINESNYKNPQDISFNTLEDVLYINMKNDVSFLLNSTMTLFEQQSTWNPNMPHRMFEYIAKLYDGYIKTNGFNIYSSKKLIYLHQNVLFYITVIKISKKKQLLN